MKNLIFSCLVVLLALGGCTEPPIVFTEPQPKDVPGKASFDIIYQGVFICEPDKSTVHVHQHTVFKEKLLELKMTEEEMNNESDVWMIDDQIYFKGFEESFPARVIDGVVYADVILKDTLFNRDKKNVIKEHRGHQILSKQLGPDKWEVLILSLDENLNLSLSAAKLPEDLEALKKITPVKDISTEEKVQYLLSPTRVEFDELMRQKLIFEEYNWFFRQKLDRMI